MIEENSLTTKETLFRISFLGLVTLFLVFLIGSVFIITLSSEKTERITPVVFGINNELISPTQAIGLFCGGKRGVLCPEGYLCELEGNYPEADGVCTNN